MTDSKYCYMSDRSVITGDTSEDIDVVSPGGGEQE